ncbi:Leishmanolysin-like peptidase [Tupaia chinensis]|uniref:Leishmanolysin-like peptidase n=1 Tax=Tupaia chinensis TaxID=246437 RepID=L9L2R2_TUPCH|nr:Leishmanolysin-like peptidase [Tupaia chinensis]
MEGDWRKLLPRLLLLGVAAGRCLHDETQKSVSLLRPPLPQPPLKFRASSLLLPGSRDPQPLRIHACHVGGPLSDGAQDPEGDWRRGEARALAAVREATQRIQGILAAYAACCQLDSEDRPLAGTIVYCAQYLTSSSLSHGDIVMGPLSSHWEARLLQGSLMTATFDGAQHTRLDTITLAAFEDTGWYQVNHSAAEELLWGHGEKAELQRGTDYPRAGPKFGLVSTCGTDSSDFFCTGSGLGCHYLLLDKGSCSSDPMLEGCRMYKPLANGIPRYYGLLFCPRGRLCQTTEGINAITSPPVSLPNQDLLFQLSLGLAGPPDHSLGEQREDLAEAVLQALMSRGEIGSRACWAAHALPLPDLPQTPKRPSARVLGPEVTEYLRLWDARVERFRKHSVQSLDQTEITEPESQATEGEL